MPKLARYTLHSHGQPEQCFLPGDARVFSLWLAEQQQYKFEELFACDALLLGRRTYEGFAAAWPNMPGTGAYGERMNSLLKYIASTTLSEVTWNATLIKGDLTEELSRLKKEYQKG